MTATAATDTPATPAPAARLVPPGPKGWPLLGVVPQFVRDPPGYLVRVAREHGDVARLPIGRGEVFLLSGPKEIEYAHLHTGREFKKGYQNDLGTRLLLGNGLVTSDGEFWRRQRRLAQPAFHRERINAYGEIMVSYTERMLAGWHDGERRDAHDEMMRLTLAIVLKTLFDRDPGEAGADDGANSAIGAAVSTAMAEWMSETARGAVLPAHIPTPGRARLRRTAAAIDAAVADVIAAHRERGDDRGDLLSMLLAARDEDGNPMSDAQLRDEAVTLYLAGHETTALALSWTFALLARYPGVEASLWDELTDVLGGRPPTVADVPRLRYTDAILKETLRLYPPAWMVARTTAAEVTVSGYTLLPETQVWMSPYAVQRDPRFWPAPEIFDPQRWLNGAADAAPAFAYFPFGGGPRKCIGTTFAQLEGVLLLATIAQRFRLHVLGPVVPQAAVTLRPSAKKGGVPVRLVAR